MLAAMPLDVRGQAHSMGSPCGSWGLEEREISSSRLARPLSASASCQPPPATTCCYLARRAGLRAPPVATGASTVAAVACVRLLRAAHGALKLNAWTSLDLAYQPRAHRPCARCCARLSPARSEQVLLVAMAFRKIDIDQFDEDKLAEEELYDPYPLAPAQAASRAKEVEREVRGLLTRCGASEAGLALRPCRGDTASALKAALADAPYGSQHTDARVRWTTRLGWTLASRIV